MQGPVQLVENNPFVLMGTLTRELDAIVEKERAIAEEKREIYARMRACAARMAASPTTGDDGRAQLTIPTAPAPARLTPQPPPAKSTPPAETPGGLLGQLLEILRAHPEAEYGELAQRLYGDATKSTRGRIATLMMQAKNAGLVEMIAVGRYRAKEVRVVAR